jgi:hypothetical protein
VKSVRRFFLLFIATAFCFHVNAQRTATGKITDAVSGKPVTASVFLSNTSIGTTSSSDGTFQLKIPDGRYEMIVSSVGYETYVVSIQSGVALENLQIKLKEKIKELENIQLEPYEKDGWEKWGKFFLENFIGLSFQAQDCRIENYKIIKFRRSYKNGELNAYAFEPLIIVNESLGYKIQYQLEEFTYKFRDRMMFYAGYPLFIPMHGSERKQRRWARERDDVYYGSQMHFMRSLYRNTLAEEGFELRKLIKIPNTEKQRVKSLVRPVAQVGSKMIISNSDSSDYYSRILAQPDFTEYLDNKLLPADSIAFAYEQTIAGLHFSDYLWVKYKNKKAPSAYQKQYPDEGDVIVSTLKLLNNEAIQIQSNGYYYDPRQILSSGYWGWSEKMATMLPFNYKPTKKAP